jgi:glyoxylase-like metal-dependent hydrolase (beta-lactamase superfamily II)
VRRVAADVYRLGRRRHNFYVVVEGGRVTVVDAGGSRELGLLLTGLGTLGLDLDAIEAVLLTHAHTDHIGFAAEVAAAGIPVKVHEDEAAFAREPTAGTQVATGDLPMWRPPVILFLAEMVRAGAHRVRPVSGVETVRDADVLDLPGRLRVVATPGHTAGHAAYLLPDRRVLFSGDALVTLDLITGATGPRLLPGMFHRDALQARGSLSRLAALDARLLLPGHGAPWHGPIAEAVRSALA